MRSTHHHLELLVDFDAFLVSSPQNTASSSSRHIITITIAYFSPHTTLVLSDTRSFSLQ